MLALLALMKPPVASSSERQSGSRHWSAAQKEELQLQALATLATIGPLMLEEYISCEGNTCLLLLLDWCVGPGQETQEKTRPSRICTVSKRLKVKGITVSYQSVFESNTKSLIHSLFVITMICCATDI